MDCWASILNNCDGGSSREHIFSESLMEGDSVTMKGFRWCRDEAMTIGTASAVSRVLCVRHNNLLSECDAEAGVLKAAMRASFATRSSKLKRKRLHVENIRGRFFSRWICKTACNAFAAEGRAIDPDMVRYAFGFETAKTYHLYLQAFRDKRFDMDFGHIHFESLNAYNDSGALILRMGFYGLDWWFSNYDIRRDEYVSFGPRQLFYTGDLVEQIGSIDVGSGYRIRFLGRKRGSRQAACGRRRRGNADAAECR